MRPSSSLATWGNTQSLNAKEHVMSQRLSGLAYGGVSLANGGAEGMFFRAEQRRKVEEARAAASKADADSLYPELLTLGIARCDASDLYWMVVKQELTAIQAREWADEMIASRPWYAK